MPSSYPGALDSLAKPTSTTLQNASGFEHDVVHTNEANSIEAVQSTIGTNPQGSFSTVKARLDDVDVSIAYIGYAVGTKASVGTAVAMALALGG